MLPLVTTPLVTFVVVVTMTIVARRGESKNNPLKVFGVCFCLTALIFGFPWYLETRLMSNECNHVDLQDDHWSFDDGEEFSTDVFDRCYTSKTRKLTLTDEFRKLESGRLRQLMEKEQKKFDIESRLLYVMPGFICLLSALILKAISGRARSKIEFTG